MKILYFSSTGNSLYVAKKLGGECISIPKIIESGNFTITDDVIGVVVPVYWLSVPAYVRDFLKRAEFQCSYLFGILTYGDNAFGAVHDLDTIPLAGETKFHYINSIKMVENYLPMYEMEKEIKKAETYNIEETIAGVKQDIMNQVHKKPKVSWISKQLTSHFRRSHCISIGKGEARHFTVSDNCSSCGQCVKICPMHNISIDSGKLKFGESCADCLGCIQNCPEEAIHTRKEKSKVRYRNPNIIVSELW